MPEVADVVVIGGGCMGTSIAWQLARRGAGRVILLERQGLAAGGTGRSSGIVRMHYTHEVVARMALHSRRVFEQFAELVDAESTAEFRRTGFLALVGPADVAAIGAVVQMHRRIGIDARLLTPAEVAEVEPRITCADIGMAAWEPDSGYADPYSTAMGFARAARRHGAEVRTDVAVTAIRADAQGVTRVETGAGAIETRTVVVAAGYRSRDLLAPLGVQLPLTPVRHAITVVRRAPTFGPIHPVVIDYVNGSYCRPEGGELTLIGATDPYEGPVDQAIEADHAPAEAEQIALIERFMRRFPGQESAELRHHYTGVYDCSPDVQPLLGPVPAIAGLHLAAGFSGHGFKLSPAVGELVAQQIVEGHTDLVDIGLFSPERFARDQPVVAPYSYSVPTIG